jgi:glycosyltransferase involved in cell wall biosynthesis
MSLTAIVPARNEARHIVFCLKSILQQTYPLEIVVMDNASADKTPELAQECLGKRGHVIRNQQNIGLAASLTRGICESKSDFVLVLPADLALGSDDYVERAIVHFKDPRVAVVTGLPYVPSYEHEKLPFAQKAFMALRRQNEFASPTARTHELSFSENRGDIYRRSILERVGLFSSEFYESGEDQVLSYNIRKLGYRILRDNTIRVMFRYGTSGQGILANLRKEFTYGKTQAGIFRKHGFFALERVELSSQAKYRARHRIAGFLFGLATLVLLCLFVASLTRGDDSLALLSLTAAVVAIMVRFSHLMGCVVAIPYDHKKTELVEIAALGLLADVLYSCGFAYGLLMSSFKRALL